MLARVNSKNNNREMNLQAELGILKIAMNGLIIISSYELILDLEVITIPIKISCVRFVFDIGGFCVLWCM